jgi:hypothetical protein
MGFFAWPVACGGQDSDELLVAHSHPPAGPSEGAKDGEKIIG